MIRALGVARVNSFRRPATHRLLLRAPAL